MTSSRRIRPTTLVRRVFVGLLGAVLLAIAGPHPVLAVGAASTSSPEIAFQAAVPVLSWQPCAAGPDFGCASAVVPLDYGDPGGSTIDLAVSRHLATDPAHRIGTLFLNTGGPGGTGARDLLAIWQLFPAAVRASFDIMSWDPRGVGASTAVQCFATAAEEEAFFAPRAPGFPVTPDEIAVWTQLAEELGPRCQALNAALLPHVSTADTARDLDLLRQAVSDPALTFWGLSYGSYLGAVYANLFPDTVRALVLDGNVDPVAWNQATPDTTTTLRVGSDLGARATLEQFLALCGGATLESCPFSAGTPEATGAKFSVLLDRLATAPVTLAAGVQVSYARTLTILLGSLYAAIPIPGLIEGWPAAAAFLETLWDESGAGGFGATAATPDAVAAAEALIAAATERYNGEEQFLGVLCAESPNPPAAAFPGLAVFAQARAGVMGPAVSWAELACGTWPAIAADGYTGPWDRMTGVNALVLNTTYDPSTPFSNAVAMVDHLAEARLLTVAGYGHTVLVNPSTCALDHATAYLIAGVLPAEGTVCAQEIAPFVAAPPIPPPPPTPAGPAPEPVPPSNPIAFTVPSFTG